MTTLWERYHTLSHIEREWIVVRWLREQPIAHGWPWAGCAVITSDNLTSHACRMIEWAESYGFTVWYEPNAVFIAGFSR